jgi:5-methyltetrahydrofolate--homocysteine methyltransferase
VKIDPAYHGPVVHVGDASRAVGVISSAAVEHPARELPRRARTDYARVVDVARPGHGSSATAVPLDVARANRLDGDWADYATPEPDLHRHAGVRRLRRRRARALHRLDAVLPHLGSDESSPRSSTTPSSPSARVRSTTTRQAMLDKIVAEQWFRPRPSSGSGPPMPTATTSSCTPTRRARRAARLHGCASRPPRPTAPNLSLRLRRPRRASPTGSAASPSPPGPRRSRSPNGSRPTTTTTQLDPAQGARRPARRGLRRADARAGAHRALGLRARRGPRPTSC